MRLGYGVSRETHIEEDAAVFKQCCGGVTGEIFFEDLNELGGRWSIDCSGHAPTTSSAANAD